MHRQIVDIGTDRRDFQTFSKSVRFQLFDHCWRKVNGCNPMAQPCHRKGTGPSASTEIQNPGAFRDSRGCKCQNPLPSSSFPSMGGDLIECCCSLVPIGSDPVLEVTGQDIFRSTWLGNPARRPSYGRHLDFSRIYMHEPVSLSHRVSSGLAVSL